MVQGKLEFLKVQSISSIYFFYLKRILLFYRIFCCIVSINFCDIFFSCNKLISFSNVKVFLVLARYDALDESMHVCINGHTPESVKGKHYTN